MSFSSRSKTMVLQSLSVLHKHMMLNGGTLSGTPGGVQAHFRRLHPEAICIVMLINSTRFCAILARLSQRPWSFSACWSVYFFFSTSLVNHHKFIEAQSKLGLTKTELVQLSNTRWACQLQSISAVLETLPAILECCWSQGKALQVLSSLCTTDVSVTSVCNRRTPQVPAEGDFRPGRSFYLQTSCVWHT